MFNWHETDRRFVAWIQRSIEPPGSPWLHIYRTTPPFIPILGSAQGYLELVTRTGKEIVVTARIGPRDRIGRGTGASGGKEGEVPSGDADAGRLLKLREMLPEAFR